MCYLVEEKGSSSPLWRQKQVCRAVGSMYEYPVRVCADSICGGRAPLLLVEEWKWDTPPTASNHPGIGEREEEKGRERAC